MGAPLGRRNDVDKGPHVGVVAGCPAQGDIDSQLSLNILGGEMALVVQDGDRLVEMSTALESHHPGHGVPRRHGVDKLRNTSLVQEGLRVGSVALIFKSHSQPGHEEAGLHQSLPDEIEVIGRVLGEHLRIRPPAHAGARPGAWHAACDAQSRLTLEGCRRTLPLEDPGDSTTKGDGVRLTSTVDLDIQSRGQRVDD